MKNLRILGISLIVLAMVQLANAQVQPVKRTLTKTDRFDFSSGGTVTVTGAPNGSIRIVGSPKNEIEIVATVEIEASNEAEIAKLAEVTGFVTSESVIRVAIGSIGSHNKFGLKKLPKDFPKGLLTLPFRIDYVITVPRYTDLEVDGGKGDLSITGVEGSMRINYLDTKGYIEVIGGNTVVTAGTGSLDMAFGIRGWRGRSANVSLGSGDLSVRLPVNMSAELDVNVLRTGAIQNAITDLKPRDRKIAFTDRSIAAKAGVGGAPLKFTVGDGSIKLARLEPSP